MSSSCCSTTVTEETIGAVAPSSAQNLLSSGGDDNPECPVMIGNQVNKDHAEASGLFRDYEGNRYWFCCASCGPLFDADPAKYATPA